MYDKSDVVRFTALVAELVVAVVMLVEDIKDDNGLANGLYPIGQSWGCN